MSLARHCGCTSSMTPTNIRRVFRSAWLRARPAEAVKNDDPVVGRVPASVIRTIAELEVTRSDTEKSESPAELNSNLTEDDRATKPRKLKVVVANHDDVIADTLAMILRLYNVARQPSAGAGG
jgi:hypothetical protein